MHEPERLGLRHTAASLRTSMSAPASNSTSGTTHLRRPSRAGSLSSSHVVKRSNSVSLPPADVPPASAAAAASAESPHTAASTAATSSHHHAAPSTSTRRRSSAAHAAHAAHDAAHVNRWSQSTAATASPARKLSISAASNANASAPPPQLPQLPPMLLAATVYDPNSPGSSSTAPSPSTAGLFTPGLLSSAQPTDYFNSKPRTPLTATHQRPPSRTKVDRVLGRSPLGSPAILAADPDPRPRAPSASRPPAAASQPRAPSAGHGRSASRDHHRSESRDAYGRSESRGHYRRSSSRDHHRTESRDHHRAESRDVVDDAHHDSQPRARERREKDKKTMLSRALQKANTAVLLDNAQNFEGAMEAYEDACKLLQQVMIRSSQDEDRRKLDAIVSGPSTSCLLGDWPRMLTTTSA